MSKLREEVKRLVLLGQSAKQMKPYLLHEGFSEQDIDDAFKEFSFLIKTQERRTRSRFYKFLGKELFDRVGYGFGSQQYVNILFYLIGAPLFLIALLNGAKVFISGMLASLMNSYSAEQKPSTKLLSHSGILFGFSFLLLAYSIYLRSLGLFFSAVILGALTIVPYGDIYHQIFKGMLQQERRNYVLAALTKYGTVVTAVSLFLAAYFLERFSLSGRTVTVPFFFNMVEFRVYGYVLVLEVAALSFIASGFLLNFIVGKQRQPSNLLRFVRPAFQSTKRQAAQFLKNKTLLILLLAGSLTSLVNTLGHAFYGIFIFTNLNKIGFGGFLNVAVIFIIAMFTAIITPNITRKSTLEYGKFPMLVFGTLLMAIMPLSYYYKPNLLSISLGTIIGITGGGIVGTAQGLLTLDILKEQDRLRFFQFSSTATVLPYVVGIPLGGLLATSLGMQSFFLILSLTLIMVVTPLYLAIVIQDHKKHRV